MSTVLLTGVTGFVGKVVLEELLRRRRELGVERVVCLIRRRGETRAAARLETVLDSPCFGQLRGDWRDRVEAVEADLAEEGWGASAAVRAALARRVTHVLHCAASIEFTLPVGEAARPNIDAALGMLDFARSCPRLVSMVSVSTAYVTPHPRAGVLRVEEALVDLPRRAQDYLAEIRAEPDCGDRLMAETGHPNTYTLTKCLAEHLLVEAAGEVPLTIARPSVVSAAWQHPVPGWIDSIAAFGGVALFTGNGTMRVFVGHPDCRLDIVPVDVVAAGIVRDGLVEPPARGSAPRISHLAAGFAAGCRWDLAMDRIQHSFALRPHRRAPALAHLGPEAHGWTPAWWRHQKLPEAVAQGLCRLRGDQRGAKRVAKAAGRVEYMNRVFHYFTNYNFDFQMARPVLPPDFDPAVNIERVCVGLYRHVLRQDDRQQPLVGRGRPFVDTGRGPAPAAARLLARTLEQGLGRVLEQVTVDLVAFEQALADVAPDELLVLAPNHRSYLDFLLLGWLAHVRPGLGLALPRFAAAADFAEVPVIGRLFEQAGAFFVERGQCGPTARAALDRRLLEVAGGDRPLVVFLEGGRSRDRRFRPPRRGVLRSLARTGRRCRVLPVGLSFDRVPEEADLAAELAGGPRPPLSLRRLLGWARRAARGEVDLGRVHLSCGTGLVLDADTDVVALAAAVQDQQRALVWPTTWQLERFVQAQGLEASRAGLCGAWLRQTLEERGATVLSSGLDPALPLDPHTERALVQGWRHWFPEAEQGLPPAASPALRALVAGLDSTASRPALRRAS